MFSCQIIKCLQNQAHPCALPKSIKAFEKMLYIGLVQNDLLKSNCQSGFTSARFQRHQANSAPVLVPGWIPWARQDFHWPQGLEFHWSKDLGLGLLLELGLLELMLSAQSQRVLSFVPIAASLAASPMKYPAPASSP